MLMCVNTLAISPLETVSVSLLSCSSLAVEANLFLSPCCFLLEDLGTNFASFCALHSVISLPIVVSFAVVVPGLELAGVPVAAGLSVRPRVRALPFVVAKLSSRVALDLRFIMLDKTSCHNCSSPVALRSNRSIHVHVAFLQQKSGSSRPGNGSNRTLLAYTSNDGIHFPVLRYVLVHDLKLPTELVDFPEEDIRSEPVFCGTTCSRTCD